MTHNLMGLLFFGILAAWTAWVSLFARTKAEEPAAQEEGDSPETPRRRRRPAWLLPVSALLAGLGLAAVFWLPVFLEREAVNLDTLIGSQDNYDFRTHFLSLAELLAPSERLDWGATEADYRFNLGLAPWLLGATGLLALLLGRVAHRRHLWFFAAALAFLIFLMLPVSTPVWEALPFLPFFQFPWRLLGAAAAILAVLAGAGSTELAGLSGRHGAYPGQYAAGQAGEAAYGRRSHVVTAVLVLLPILSGLPLSQPAPWPDFAEVNHLRISLIENTGRWLGTTSTADYVPATVDIIPPRKGSVVANFGLGLPPDRINRDALPDEATIETQVLRPLHTRYILDTPRATRLRLYLFDFPGWQVRIDGELAETELGRPEGFLVIPVPAGRHQVDVAFGSTPPRTAASAISLAALAGVLLVAWRLPGLAPPRERGRFRDWLILGAVVALTALFAFLLEPSGWLHDSSPAGIAEPAQVQADANLGDQVALLGYDLEPAVIGPGQSLAVTLYWQAQRPLEINYQSFVHLIAPDGALAAQSDHLNPGDYPTRRWPLEKYVRDRHEIVLPPDLPPGDYTLRTGLWVQSEGWRLPLFDASGVQIGDSIPMARLTISPNPTP
jgi:hypothetical protein